MHNLPVWLIDTHIVVAVITGVAAVICAIISNNNKNKLNEIHISINSRLDQLVSASVDKGRIMERDSSLAKTQSFLEDKVQEENKK